MWWLCGKKSSPPNLLGNFYPIEKLGCKVATLPSSTPHVKGWALWLVCFVWGGHLLFYMSNGTFQWKLLCLVWFAEVEHIACWPQTVSQLCPWFWFRYLWSRNQGSCSVFTSAIATDVCVLGVTNHKLWHAIVTGWNRGGPRYCDQNKPFPREFILPAALRNCGSQCQSLVKRKETIYSKVIQV